MLHVIILWYFLLTHRYLCNELIKHCVKYNDKKIDKRKKELLKKKVKILWNIIWSSAISSERSLTEKTTRPTIPYFWLFFSRGIVSSAVLLQFTGQSVYKWTTRRTARTLFRMGLQIPLYQQPERHYERRATPPQPDRTSKVCLPSNPETKANCPFLIQAFVNSKLSVLRINISIYTRLFILLLCRFFRCHLSKIKVVSSTIVVYVSHILVYWVI